MTNLAEREKGRTDLVAAAHSLRVMLIAIVIPFGLKALGFQGNPVLGPVAKDIVPLGLALMFGLALVAVWVLERWGRANPWFLGGLGVSMALSLSGHTLTAVPTWMVNASQLLIGISLGVQFSGDFIKSAPKWMLSVGIGTMSLIGVCCLFALGISKLSGIDTLTMVLGTAPGGIAEMAITAKVLHLGVPLVTTLQVCRLIAVLILVEPLYKYCYQEEPHIPSSEVL
jgi:membrane AbrB-like protein